jgi:hypothetical protein
MIGSFAYHFWMKDMIPLLYGNGNQYLHRKSTDYRNYVKRKIHAYGRLKNSSRAIDQRVFSAATRPNNEKEDADTQVTPHPGRCLLRAPPV